MRQAAGTATSGSSPRARRFTLVELLVVIVVIGILAAIAIPVFLSQADKASDTALKSDLTNAAKLLQVAEANGDTLPSEITAGQVVDLGSAGTFTSTETLTVKGSGDTLCVEGTSDSGTTYSADLSEGVRDYNCAGIQTGALVTDGLVLHLDAADPKSYPGTGATWYDLTGDSNGTLLNGVGYSSNNKGALTFDGVNDRGTFSTPVTEASPQTYEVWTNAVSAADAYTDFGYILHNNEYNSHTGNSFLTIGVNPSQRYYAAFNGPRNHAERLKA
jgi:prepilin-type N-terminal cleavage/methylation domain